MLTPDPMGVKVEWIGTLTYQRPTMESPRWGHHVYLPTSLESIQHSRVFSVFPLMDDMIGVW